jgi:hypothetical protein
MNVGARRSLRDSGFDIVLFDRDIRIIFLEVLFGGVRTEGESVVARRHEVATDVVPQGFVPKPVLVWWLGCRGMEMKKTPWMVASLLNGMSEAIDEYVKGGGSPTGGVFMPGWWRGEGGRLNERL